MTAPNIVNVSTITAKTASAALGTSAASIVSNAASSNKVFKINTILVSNVDGTNNADVTIYLNDGAAGRGAGRRFAGRHRRKQQAVPRRKHQHHRLGLGGV